MRPVGLGANLVFTGVIFKISFMLVWLVTACGVSDTGFYKAGLYALVQNII